MITDIIDTMKKAIIKPKEDKLMLLLSDKTKETKSVYLSQINKFRAWKLKVSYDKWDVREFLKYLQDEGYSSSYIKGSYWALKLYFESEGWLWEAKMPKMSAPLPKVAMSKDDVKRLIQVSILRGSPEERAYLALSTTYGLRRAEMAQINQKDFDWQHKTIFIRTKKGGVVRNHLIPDSISPFLRGYSFNGACSPYTISMLWHTLETNAGMKFEKGTGWHAIRHRLNIELVEAGLPEIMVLNFMRWKYRQSMAAYYYTPSQRDSDQTIFSNHPFIKIWLGG